MDGGNLPGHSQTSGFGTGTGSTGKYITTFAGIGKLAGFPSKNDNLSFGQNASSSNSVSSGLGLSPLRKEPELIKSTIAALGPKNRYNNSTFMMHFEDFSNITGMSNGLPSQPEKSTRNSPLMFHLQDHSGIADYRPINLSQQTRVIHIPKNNIAINEQQQANVVNVVASPQKDLITFSVDKAVQGKSALHGDLMTFSVSDAVADKPAQHGDLITFSRSDAVAGKSAKQGDLMTFSVSDAIVSVPVVAVPAKGNNVQRIRPKVKATPTRPTGQPLELEEDIEIIAGSHQSCLPLTHSLTGKPKPFFRGPAKLNDQSKTEPSVASGSFELNRRFSKGPADESVDSFGSFTNISLHDLTTGAELDELAKQFKSRSVKNQYPTLYLPKRNKNQSSFGALTEKDYSTVKSELTDHWMDTGRTLFEDVSSDSGWTFVDAPYEEQIRKTLPKRIARSSPPFKKRRTSMTAANDGLIHLNSPEELSVLDTTNIVAASEIKALEKAAKINADFDRQLEISLVNVETKLYRMQKSSAEISRYYHVETDRITKSLSNYCKFGEKCKATMGRLLYKSKQLGSAAMKDEDKTEAILFEKRFNEQIWSHFIALYHCFLYRMANSANEYFEQTKEDFFTDQSDHTKIKNQQERIADMIREMVLKVNLAGVKKDERVDYDGDLICFDDVYVLTQNVYGMCQIFETICRR